jgi:hypothetical protein
MKSSYKYKVPCDALLSALPAEALDGKSSGDDFDEKIGVHLGGDDYFPQEELCTDKTISFEFFVGDPVGLWCYAKTKKAAEAIVDYIAHQEGEVPSDLYHRIIYRA